MKETKEKKNGNIDDNGDGNDYVVQNGNRYSQ